MFDAFQIVAPNDIVEWFNIPAMLGNLKVSSFFPLVLDNASAVGFTVKHGLLANSRNCGNCGDAMHLNAYQSVTASVGCVVVVLVAVDVSRAVRRRFATGRFSKGRKFSIKELLTFIPLWAKKMPLHLIKEELDIDCHTAVDCSNFSRDVAVE